VVASSGYGAPLLRNRAERIRFRPLDYAEIPAFIHHLTMVAFCGGG